jgi:hypothetical protein
MGLLADPARLDAGDERAPRGTGRHVAQVVFGLAGRASLADQPDRLIGQAAVVGSCVAIGHADTGRCKADGKRPLGSLPPGHAPPRQTGQHLLRRTRFLARARSPQAERPEM